MINKEKKFFRLTPFKMQVLQSFPFIDADFDALNNYELLCKVVEYLNITVDNVNLLNDDFITLYNYVHDYFDNLDVQEEINNKLDDMAESGELQEIITAYLQVNGILAFNSVADMKLSENLLDGSFAETYGFYAVNDGGSAKYKIRELESGETANEITLISLQNDLVAELIIEENMSVKQFGAKGDATNDDSDAFQIAVNSNASCIEIPETNNYYLINDEVEIPSNKYIKGYGNKSFLRSNNNIEKPLFSLTSVYNITIDNIHIENDSTQSGNNPSIIEKYFILGNYCEKIRIINCYFNKCYSRGIEFGFSKNIEYLNNKFTNATFNMFHLRPETENVVVDNCLFDTCTSTYQNTYLFSTGRVNTNTFEYGSKNVTVKNSTFLNNPNWEGIDTHMCLGFYCYNNYIENVNAGIMANISSTAPIVSASNLKEVHGNIFIENNIIKKGNNSNSYAINVGSNTDLVENINVKGNIIYGFGITNQIQNGSLRATNIKSLNINNNIIRDANSSSISITNSYNVKIIGNECLEQNGNTGINFVTGVWNIIIADNIIKNIEKTKLNNGVRSANVCYAQIENNEIYAATRYNLKGTLIAGNGTITDSTTQLGKIGDFVKNQYGIPTYYCTNSDIKPAKSETLSSLNISGDAGDNVVTCNNAMTTLCIGEEITIPGVGEDSADVTCIITDFISPSKFTVNKYFNYSFSNIHPSVTAGTWVSLT